MPSARTIKARNKKYYKSNSESIRSRRRDNYQNNPQNKKDASRAKLDALSAQLIQLAKCYQTVVRLGTYTGKVPIYNSLKACNGTMFFLPLPLNKTLDTLHQANFSGRGVSALPDPELYIIVNGKPTKSKIVWYSLVKVANINAAVCKLKEINWLYGVVHKDSVDVVYKKVIEITNSATSRMLAKASESDVLGFQAFTVRNLDNKLSTDTDIEQYKLLNVREDPLSNRQEHLDVMYFPTLFPTGKFGKNHPREVKISHSEKSRLLNKRFSVQKTCTIGFLFNLAERNEEILCRCV